MIYIYIYKYLRTLWFESQHSTDDDDDDDFTNINQIKHMNANNPKLKKTNNPSRIKNNIKTTSLYKVLLHQCAYFCKTTKPKRSYLHYFNNNYYYKMKTQLQYPHSNQNHITHDFCVTKVRNT